MALQRQSNTLKRQLDPHFLFNALNSFSVLIGEDPERAEQFVDKLAWVYRYMLQANRRPGAQSLEARENIVPLSAELKFITTYADLLQVRYGHSLRIEQAPVNEAYTMRGLLSLSLLTLVENALKHNDMSASNPLIIHISTTPDRMICVVNNRQHRTLCFEASHDRLSNLMANYKLVAHQTVLVESSETLFRVSLPLVLTGDL